MLTITSNTLQKTVNAMSRDEPVASAFVQWLEYEVTTEEVNRFINTLMDGRERRAYQLMRDAVMLLSSFQDADRAIAAVGDRKLQREMRNIMANLPTTQYAMSLLTQAGPGAWYDPSDLTTLFQDSAGTTPVTAVEQPVGLMLDKSKGLVLGAELVTNRDFSNGNTGWVRSGPSWSGLTGAMVNDGTNVVGAQCQQNSIIATGKTYRIEFDLTRTSGTLNVWLNGSQLVQAGIATSGRKTFTVASTVSGNFMVEASAGAVLSIDNISVREIPGAHLIQPTATSRPTLSSRYNLLTKTEQFDDVHWTKTTGTTVTASSATAPDGTLTADTVAYNGTGASGSYRLYSGVAPISITGAGYTAKVWLRADAPVTMAISGNTVAGVVTSVNVTTDWQQFTISGTGNGVSAVQLLIYSPAGNNAAFQVYAWGASVTNASDASLPYQRVNTATDYDYDFSKFPPYLKFDGVDDSLYTAASVDFTSTDKMTVFAGVHKASDSGVQTVVELSSDAIVNNGAFTYWLNGYSTGIDAAALSGTAGVYPVAALSAPATRVLSLVGDIASDTALIRHNGAQVGSSAGDQGTGNYGNHVLYIGRSNNSIYPFSGRIYQLAIKGKAMTAAEISTVESYINSKTKAY